MNCLWKLSIDGFSLFYLYKVSNNSNDWSISWFLTPFSTVFQLYRDGQCAYPCFPGVLVTSILQKPQSREKCLWRSILMKEGFISNACNAGRSTYKWDRRYGVMVRVSASWTRGRGFDPRLRQTKVFKTGSSDFLPWRSGLWGIALRLARQCQDNGLVKYWIKTVQETWIYELSPLNSWNTVDTA